MPNTLFDALFAPLATRDDDFLILPDGGTITGRAFLAMVARQAHALREAGLGVGDRIAVQVAKSPEALAVYGARLLQMLERLFAQRAVVADLLDLEEPPIGREADAAQRLRGA